MKEIKIVFNNGDEMGASVSDQVATELEKLIQRGTTILAFPINNELAYIPMSAVQRIHFKE